MDEYEMFMQQGSVLMHLHLSQSVYFVISSFASTNNLSKNSGVMLK